jgi:hypothetical protein
VSIEEIQLFQAASSSLDSYNTGTRLLTGATEIFDWMAPADGYIELEDINSGASSLDLLMYIPESAFRIRLCTFSPRWVLTKWLTMARSGG